MRVQRVDHVQSARSNMVFTQLKTNGVTDESILRAFETIPRENFIPVSSLSLAYSDSPIYCEIPGRYLFPPQTLGVLLQNLNLQPNDKVLVVGGNYGYTATLLFELECVAFVVESHPIFIAKCREKLKKYNAEISGTRLNLGFPENSPYKAIIVELGLESIPDNIINQLDENGRIAVCLSTAEKDTAKACVFEKKSGSLHQVFTIEANMPLCTELINSDNFKF